MDIKRKKLILQNELNKKLQHECVAGLRKVYMQKNCAKKFTKLLQKWISLQLMSIKFYALMFAASPLRRYNNYGRKYNKSLSLPRDRWINSCKKFFYLFI